MHSDQSPDEFHPRLGLGSGGPTRVLLVEDSPDYAQLVEHELERDAHEFELQHVERLDEALHCLESSTFDAMVVDLTLPDGDGAFTIGCACSLANHLPVIVLTGRDDESLSLAAMKSGAQDYLVKDRLSRSEIPSAILRAIERHLPIRAYYAPPLPSYETTRQGLSDPETGLLGQVAFLDRLEHSVAQADRHDEGFAVISIDRIIDPEHVDQAGPDERRRIANALRGRLRRSDSIARVAENSMAVIVANVTRSWSLHRAVGGIISAIEDKFGVWTSGRDTARLGQPIRIGGVIHPGAGCDGTSLLDEARESIFAVVDPRNLIDGVGPASKTVAVADGSSEEPAKGHKGERR